LLGNNTATLRSRKLIGIGPKDCWVHSRRSGAHGLGAVLTASGSGGCRQAILAVLGTIRRRQRRELTEAVWFGTRRSVRLPGRDYRVLADANVDN